MKRFLLLLLFVTSLSFAQNNGITYQAIIYNPEGEELPGVNNPYAPIVNQGVCLQFGIVDADGNLEYQEQANVITDDFGMVNLIIGTYPQSAGYASSFSEIQWSSDSKFLVVDLDIKGSCTDFVEISNQPLSYVPFALYAENSSADENIDALTALVEQIETDSNAAIAALQADVDQNEADSDTTDTVLQAQIDDNEIAANDAIDALQADVDQNEADSDTADAALQAQIDANETTANDAIDALQADVDQNEADSDTADATLQAQIDANETTANDAIDALQADVDQNEADNDTADAALQAQIDNNETAANNAIDALQADVDQNEADSDTADAALQAQVDQNEADIDFNLTSTNNAIIELEADINEVQNIADNALIDASLAHNAADAANNAIATLQVDVDQNEADIDFNLTSTNNAIIELEADINEVQNNADNALIDASLAHNAADAANNAIATLQVDVDQNEADSDGADAALQAQIDANETAANNAIATLQADVDQNEADSDATDATLQAQIDANETAANDAIDALQADVDQNETDSDAADATIQEDVDQNEEDSDAADTALQLELDTTQSGSGLQDDGSYVANTSMNYINESTSIVDATEDLDAAIAALQESNSALQALIEDLQSQVDNLTNTGTYTPTLISGSGTFTEANWFQIGDMVIVIGNFNDGDLSYGQEITIDTPTTNTFSSSTDVSGNVAGFMAFNESVGGSVRASPGTNRVVFSGAGAHGDGFNTDGGYIFSYNLGGGTTYTPTTNGNITLSPANYSINGSTVIVNGNFSNGDFGFFNDENIEISIPTSSTFSNAYDATGVASAKVMGFESGAGHVEAVPNSSSVKISIQGAHMIAFDAEGSYTFTYNTSSAGGLTYNPSVTSGSATISNVQYFKYGNMVIVSGLIDNASSGTVISIPVSSFFTSPYDVKGLVTGSYFESAAGIIQAVPNSETVQINFRGAHGQSNFDQGSFIFTYKL